MTDVSTKLVVTAQGSPTVSTFDLSNTAMQVGGAGASTGGGGTSGSGMTQAAADARYIQQSQINAASGVAGLDSSSFLSEAQLPLPAVDLTVLFNNKLA